MKKLSEFRKEYSRGKLEESGVPSDPMELFGIWMRFVIESDLSEPNAMILATSTEFGIPSARVVLLKEVNRDGFVFFTNYFSRKGQELAENPYAALVFDWHEIERQVRVEGRAKRVPETDSDIYFHERPRSARIGAWASPQSKTLKDRSEIEQLQTFYEEKFEGQEIIPRPPHWGGYIVLPSIVEFWQGRQGRLHDRIVYQKTDGGWKIERLAP